MSFSSSLINNMITIAQNSGTGFKLAAVLLKSTTPIGNIKANCDKRMYCHGKICPSMHAEASVLTQHFGSSLSFRQGKWYVLQGSKKAKVT
jgi:hypothetical protein